jgi:DNA-binding Lrp family transcriptional regulator
MTRGQAGLDTVDRCIVAALQIHGRASWQQLARAVGASDSTVARRVHRLFDEGLVRVAASTDPLLCDQGYPVVVQITSEPGAATAVAQRLAARPDVRFAALITGSSDVVIELIVRSQTELARILFTEIDRAPGIRSTTTESVLAHYKMAHMWSHGTLPEEAATALAAERGVVEPGAPRPLDEREQAIVDVLAEDARAGYALIAQRLGTSESAVRRRLDGLIREGRVRFTTIVEPELLGYGVKAMCWLAVDLSHLEESARALSARPEVRYVAATAGYSDITIEVVLRDQQDLHRFLTQVLGALAGLRRAEVGLELATLKRAFVLDESVADLFGPAPETTGKGASA